MSRLCKRAMLQRDREIRALLSATLARSTEGNGITVHNTDAEKATNAGQHAETAAQSSKGVVGNAREGGSAESTTSPQVGKSDGEKVGYAEAKRRSREYAEAMEVLLGSESPFAGWLRNAETLSSFRT
eukprot:3030275-Rhodomonas_salina.1